MRRLLLLLIAWLTRLTYKKVTLDQVNKKLLKPVPGLIIDGQQYYQFVQVADMPQNRFVHYQDFREESKMSMDREDLLKYAEELIKANDKDNKSRVGLLAYTLQDAVANCTPIEVLYNLASLVYFTKDEDISCYDLDYNNAKIAQFKKVQDKGFFLRTLLEKTLKVTGKSLPANIDKYLRQSEAKINAYKQWLSDDSGNATASASRR